MSKLYFHYSTMNAGKSSSLLQTAFNYREMGQRPILFTAEIDDRYSVGTITSRIGLSEMACVFPKDGSFFTNMPEEEVATRDVVLVDEAQFMSKEQVKELALFAWKYKVPVMCYGLRVDFRGELFEGSAALFAYATNFVEMRTLCGCGKRATHAIRVDSNGKVLKDGDVVEIGANNLYRSLCQHCFFEKTETN